MSERSPLTLGHIVVSHELVDELIVEYPTKNHVHAAKWVQINMKQNTFRNLPAANGPTTTTTTNANQSYH